METNLVILSTQKKLKTRFTVWFSVLIGVGAWCFLSDVVFPKMDASIGVNLQQVLILCMLGGIPGVLVWSKKKMRQLVDVADISDRLRRYAHYVQIRQTVFFSLGFAVLFLYVFSVMNGAFMLFMVVVCLCVFIVPTKGRLELEAHVKECASEV